ncbi:MAG: SUMO ligase siz1 [Chaenotheca gracillima]|nr:MAG: SUMO ligase siz1 [Chaenotheca gracillima]
MASGAHNLDTRGPASKVKLLLNKQLINILKEERLPHSGVKAAMQARIITHIEDYARKGDVERFKRLRDLIFNPDSLQSPANPKYAHPQSGPSTPITSTPYAPANGSLNGYGGASFASSPSFSGRIMFNTSPFYTILESLTPTEQCPAMSCHRHTVTIPLKFQRGVGDRLRSDPSLRVMVYCAADSALGPYTRADISFPHQVELRVNNDEIKANLRGLKNKPGSTRPADITASVHKNDKYQNSVTMTYALTTKKFSIVINLVRRHTVDELVSRLKTGKLIPKEKVINEMVSRAQDADIVATSTVMSLKCPLSTLRIDLPCRATVCLHNQCFDAASFLQLQEQGPTWTCPICNKTISFEALMVDKYVEDILKKTSRSTEQVTIEPDGRWSANNKPSTPSRANGRDSSDDGGDDDLIEIQDSRVASLKKEATPFSNPLTRTPPSSSREPSAPSAPAYRSTSGKRPAAAVIDLTLSESEDEDDEPPRPAKRQMTHYNNGATASSHDRNGYYDPPNNRPQGVNFHLPPAKPRTSIDDDYPYFAQ